MGFIRVLKIKICLKVFFRSKNDQNIGFYVIKEVKIDQNIGFTSALNIKICFLNFFKVRISQNFGSLVYTGQKLSKYWLYKCFKD